MPGRAHPAARALVLVLALTACSGDADHVAAPVTSISLDAPASASASALPPIDRRRHIDLPITKASVVSFEMNAPMEKQRATFTGDALGGVVYLDTLRLDGSRGDVSVDLGRMVVEQATTADPDGEYGAWQENPKQNEHAKQWLEIGLENDPQKAELNRRAVLKATIFIDRELHNSTATYEAEIRLSGTLTIHQHTESVTLPGVLTVVNSRRTPSVRFRSTEPLHVDLARFDVVPRDALGAVLEKGLDALAPKVAKTADVAVDVTFAVE